jgi:hypothetical protein
VTRTTSILPEDEIYADAKFIMLHDEPFHTDYPHICYFPINRILTSLTAGDFISSLGPTLLLAFRQWFPSQWKDFAVFIP